MCSYVVFVLSGFWMLPFSHDAFRKILHLRGNRWRRSILRNAKTGGADKARFNVATPTYEARTRPLHVQHTNYRIIFKQNPFNIISRGVQR